MGGLNHDGALELCFIRHRLSLVMDRLLLDFLLGLRFADWDEAVVFAEFVMATPDDILVLDGLGQS